MHYGNILPALGVAWLAAMLAIGCGQSQDTCSESDTANYKATVTTTGGDADAIGRSTLRVSGEDSHLVASVFTHEEVFTGGYEWVVKDGVTYYREDGGSSGASDWRIEERSDQNIFGLSCWETDTASSDNGTERYSSRTTSLGRWGKLPTQEILIA